MDDIWARVIQQNVTQQREESDIQSQQKEQVQGVRQGVKALSQFLKQKMGKGPKSRKTWNLKGSDHGYLITFLASFLLSVK